MNRVAAGVRMGWTSAPVLTSWRMRSAALYAAMEPVTPRTRCFPESDMAYRYDRAAHFAETGGAEQTEQRA